MKNSSLSMASWNPASGSSRNGRLQRRERTLESAARQVSRSSKLPALSDGACLGPFSGVDVHLLGSERVSQAGVVCVCRAGDAREVDADAVGCDGCAFGTFDAGPCENHPSDLRRPASVPKTPAVSVAASTADLSNIAVGVAPASTTNVDIATAA